MDPMLDDEHSKTGAPQARVANIGLRILDGAMVLVVGTVILAAAAAGILALHMRAAAEGGIEANPPVSVATVKLKRSKHYEKTAEFVGRLEAARQTSLAFERGGLVLRVAFEEGERVREGDVIARLDTQQLVSQRKQLEAQVREIESQLALSKATLERQSSLNKRGWSPEQRYDEARYSVAQFRAGIERTRAQIESLDIDIEKSTVRAPFAGTVAARAIDEGSVVAAGTPIITLLESDVRRVRVGLPPDVADEIVSKQIYAFRSGKLEFSGQLFAKRADLQTGTRTVTTLFDVNGAANVPFGEITVLQLRRDVTAPGAWLPLAALSEGRKGMWSIFVVDQNVPDPTVKQEAVEVLYTSASRAYVRGSFDDGAEVIVSGTNRVISGQRVAQREAE